MFLPITFNTSIELSPSELKVNFEETVKKKIKLEYEGLCSKHGFIKPNSIHIVKRSIGIFSKQHFNGNIHFDLLCNGEVCNPIKGLVVEAQIKNKNALGLLAESTIEIDDDKIPVLDIIIPRKAAGILSEIDLDAVNINDTIYVMILSKKYQLNDQKIAIIGKAVKSLESNIDDLAENKVDELNIQGQQDIETDDDVSISDDESKSEHSEEGGSEISINIKKLAIDDPEPEPDELEDDLEEELEDDLEEDTDQPEDYDFTNGDD